MQRNLTKMIKKIFQYQLLSLFIIENPFDNKNKSMYPAYNASSYYRANPYSKEGYIPPMAHKNRHPQQHYSQIPTGQQYYDNSGKKHYRNLSYRSQIQENNVMSSPQKYPYENRIAMDKSYFRSLNTIDIQGSTPGTIMSQAVKNKIKAQQELSRRKRQQFQNREAAYGNEIQRVGVQQQRFGQQATKNKQYSSTIFQKSEEQKRRQFAMRQLQKNRELADLLSRKNYHKVTQDKRNDQIEWQKRPQYENGPQILKNYQSQYLQTGSNNNRQLKSNQILYAPHDAKKKIVFDYQNAYSNSQLSRGLKPRIENNYIQQRHQTNAEYHQYPKKDQSYSNIIQYPHQNSKFYSVQMSRQAQQLQRQNTFRAQQQIAKANPEKSLQNLVYQPKQVEVSMNHRLDSSGQQHRRGSNYGSRELLRKMNPTYLSFASPTFGLAGKNTLGY